MDLLIHRDKHEGPWDGGGWVVISQGWHWSEVIAVCETETVAKATVAGMEMYRETDPKGGGGHEHS